MRSFVRVWKREVDKELQRDFAIWLRSVLRKRDILIDVSKLDEMEVRPMLEAQIDAFERRVLRRGRREGKMEGKIEGETEGLRKALGILLESRFGDEGARFFKKICRIEDRSALERITRLAVRAESLREIGQEIE